MPTNTISDNIIFGFPGAEKTTAILDLLSAPITLIYRCGFVGDGGMTQ